MGLTQLTPEAVGLWRQLEAARREIGNLRRENEQLADALLEVRDAYETLDQPHIGGRRVHILAPLSATRWWAP